jgi:hypothetical protein
LAASARDLRSNGERSGVAIEMGQFQGTATNETIKR